MRVLILSTILLLACYESETPLVNCPVVEALHYEMEGNAGCMIISDGKMLVVRDKKSGKLGFPAGAAVKTEKATCTAYRETLEETGNQVIVRSLLAYFKEENFFLFDCQLRSPVKTTVPAGVADEIDFIYWLSPIDLKSADWRFSEQFETVIRIFKYQSNHISRGK